jgi:hypothetical protein
MPGFIKTPKDEKKWNDIKHSVAKQYGKNVKDFGNKEWAIVNAVWHKSEIEGIKKSLSVKIPSATKMPKPKHMPSATDKPSKFFKKEQTGDIKKTSIQNLKDFLDDRRDRK